MPELFALSETDFDTWLTTNLAPEKRVDENAPFLFLSVKGLIEKTDLLARPGLSSRGLPPHVGVIFVNAAEAFGSQQTGSGAIWSFCELQPQAGVCYSLHTPTHIHVQAHSSTQI